MSTKQADALAELRGDLLPALAAFVEASRHLAKRRTINRLTRELEKTLAGAFRTQGKLVLRKMASFRDRFTIQESISPKEWSIVFGDVADETLDLFSRPLLLAVQQALKAGGNQMVASFGMSDLFFGLANPGAVRFLGQVGGLHIRNINETTREAIQTLLSTGSEEGWSYDKVAAAIRDRFEEFAIGRPQEHIESRAHLVAVTEIGEAYENAGFIAAGDLRAGGVQMEKMWVTTGDNKVSDGCAQNEAQGWIPYETTHMSGHQHPLRFPGCRCDEIYRRKAAN